MTIAGSDSSGGAGIQADIKTISATGCYAASVITALTAQNTCGVQSIYGISPDFIIKQSHAVLSDLPVQTIKIGMLHNQETIRAVEAVISAYPMPHIVLDPVMVSKNGCSLLDQHAISALLEYIIPHVFLITPNLSEAEKILGLSIKTADEMMFAAEEIATQYHVSVLLKGGHLNGAHSSDVLYDFKKKSLHWFHEKRINTRHTHGTGCSLSSAIASFLAQDYNLHEAVLRSKNYITQAIISGSQHQLGQGCGPIDHFYNLKITEQI
jgi:hydroxymethylpyrimidine/phosphomethylpyrimidine kinase